MQKFHRALGSSLPVPRTEGQAAGFAWRAASRTRLLVLAGVFAALTVLLTYVFAVQTPFVRFSFGFLPLALYGALAGPWRAALVAAAADLIGVSLFGTGAFFPGFTLSALLVGAVYGASFHGRPLTVWRVALTFLFVDTAVHLVLNTLWLYLLYGKGVAALLASRVPKIVLCYPLRVAMFLIVSRPLLQFAAGRR